MGLITWSIVTEWSQYNIPFVYTLRILGSYNVLWRSFLTILRTTISSSNGHEYWNSIDSRADFDTGKRSFWSCNFGAGISHVRRSSMRFADAFGSHDWIVPDTITDYVWPNANASTDAAADQYWFYPLLYAVSILNLT